VEVEAAYLTPTEFKAYAEHVAKKLPLPPKLYSAAVKAGAECYGIP
jgi:hypothetical protein